MKHDGLEVRLRPCVEQNSYMPEFGLEPKAECNDSHSPNAATCVLASPHIPFEVCVELEASFAPHSAQVLAVEIETRSVIERGSKEMEVQTWSIPLRRESTTSKKKRGLGAEFAREYCFSAYTFWTRDKSPPKFSSISHPFLTPRVGERVTVRVQRGRLPQPEILPRLPMKEHDTNPARAPTEAELDGSTIIDKRWFKRILGWSGKTIEFVFEVCDEDYMNQMLKDTSAPAKPTYERQARADDCDDEEPIIAIKTEDQSDASVPSSSKEVEDRSARAASMESQSWTAKPFEDDELEDRDNSANKTASIAIEACVLRPRTEQDKNVYRRSYQPADARLYRSRSSTATTEHQADPSASKEERGILPDTLEANKQHVQQKGATSLKPRAKRLTTKQDVSSKTKQPAKRGRPPKAKRGPGRPRKDPDDPKWHMKELKALEQQSAGKRKSLDQGGAFVLITNNPDSDDVHEQPRESSRDKTDTRAKKKAKLALEMKELKVEKRMLSIEKEMMDLEE